MITKPCMTCNKRPAEEQRRVCYRCRYAATKDVALEKRQARRDEVNAYKAERGCIDCGIKNPVVLDLDHRPGEVKLFSVAKRVAAGAFDLLWEEIAKCDVRCANCHRIITAERKQVA